MVASATSQHHAWRRSSHELVAIIHSASAASFFSSPSHPHSFFLHAHFVANLGRLLFVASRAAFQLAPNLVLVLPVLLLSRCFPLSRRPLFVSPSARLAQVTSATLCHLLSSFAPLLRSAPSSCPSFAHGLPLHPRCTGCHGAAHLFFYVTLTLRSVDLWMAAAPL